MSSKELRQPIRLIRGFGDHQAQGLLILTESKEGLANAVCVTFPDGLNNIEFTDEKCGEVIWGWGEMPRPALVKCGDSNASTRMGWVFQKARIHRDAFGIS